MKKIFYFALTLLIAAGCGKFEDINTNPDAATTVPSSFLASGVIYYMTTQGSSKQTFQDSWLVKQSGMTEHHEDYMYNRLGRSSFSGYSYLIDAAKMVEIAEADESMSDSKKNAYRALNLFTQAYVFFNATLEMGDVPCSEALLAESEGVIAPKYDSQEDVIAYCISCLQESAKLFGNASALDGDFVYGGDPDKWERAANSLLLRVLNMVSKKSTVGGQNVQSLFEATAAKALISSENDSFMRTYSSSNSKQWYPFYMERQNFWVYPVMYSFFVDMMKDLGDYRIFYYCEPFKQTTASEDSFDAYEGTDGTAILDKIQAALTSGAASSINKRYYEVAQGEPCKFIAYSETQFILAEAALRGWKTPATAKQHYENGVTAAMTFTYENTPADYRHGREMDAAYIESYLAGPAAFDATKGLEQIMTQKYIGSFVQLPYVSYFDFRRTGYPVLPLNPDTNLNTDINKYPVRWMYPSSEYNQNSENVNAAVKSQFGSAETNDGIMWILK